MKYLTALIGIVIITGCTGGSLKPTVPKRDDARAACPVHTGTVLATQDVIIEGEIEGAQVVGAAIGGALAYHAVGDSTLAQIAATAGGAMAGSVAGNMVGEAALNTPGQELIVTVDGVAHSIIQGNDSSVSYAPGDPVWVIGELPRVCRRDACAGSYYDPYYSRGNSYCKTGIRVLPKE